MTDIRRLDTLPPCVLIEIFDYCTMFDLLRLSRTCKYFNNIMWMDVAWTRKSREMLFTNQLSKRFRERCNPLLSSRDKCIVSQNWQYRNMMKYETNVYKVPQCNQAGLYIQMTKDTLWWSCRNNIHGFKRTRHGIIAIDIIRNETIRTDCRSSNNCSDHVKQFVLCNKDIISSHENGSIKKWTNKRKKTNRLCLAGTYSDSGHVLAIDATSQYIFSSHTFRDDEGFHGLKIRKHTNMSEETNSKEYIIPLKFTAHSLAIDPTGTKLVAGCNVVYGNSPSIIYVFDINNAPSKLSEYSKYQTRFRSMSKISDIIWKDPHTLLICGNIFIRKWDVRVGKCVGFWEGSQNNNYTLQCISSDYQYTIMTGATHEIVFAWDQRQNACVTTYYLLSDASLNYAKHNVDSEVIHRNIIHDEGTTINSLQFDSSHLYAASCKRLYEYNFFEAVNQNGGFSELVVE